MTALEDALRTALRERADQQRAPDIAGLAERAILAGRASRRRRMGGLAAAVVVVCVLFTASATVVVFGVHGPMEYRPGAEVAAPGEYVAVSSPMPPTNPDVPVDYVQAGWLYLRSGRSVKLPTANASQVQRAGDGFVVVEQVKGDGEQHAWYVNERTGVPVKVLDSVRSVAVSTDGTGRIAWLDGPKMYYQTTVVPLAQAAATARAIATDRPSSGGPVGFVGDAVLLADPALADPERHDLWFPDRGDYDPTWTSFRAVYGVRGNAELVVATTVRKRMCLGFVQMSTLKLDEPGCHFVDWAPNRGWVSPSGRWLVVADRRQAQMFDLFAGWRTGAQVVWSVDQVGTDAAWLDRDTVALHTSTGVVVLSPFANEKAVEYKVPGLSLIVSQ